MVFSPFSIAITSLGEERANLGAFRTFVRFALVWFCLFPLPLGVCEVLRFVIVELPGLFSYLFGRNVLGDFIDGRAYRFSLIRMSVYPCICLSVTFYSSVHVSAILLQFSR